MRTALLAVAFVAASMGGARADECEPIPPAQAIAEARAAGKIVLTGKDAAAFAERLRTEHAPVPRADYVFLGRDGGAPTVSWIDEAEAPIAIQCEWEATPGGVLAAAVEAALKQRR